MKHIYIFFCSILVSSALFAQPANDDCVNAELVTVGTTLSSFTFEIIDATVNNEEGCDTALSDYVDVWYEFTMPVNGNLFIDGVTSWNNFGLFDACNGNLIQCGAGDEFISGLTSGTNYKLRVFRTTNLADNGFTSFGLQAFEEVTNDTCNDAETITVTSTEETPYDFNIGGADVLNEEGCNTALSDYVDVWYEFTMPVNGNLFINGITSWNNFGLYDACNGNLIQCGVGDEFISGLTSGTNYKLRVFRIVSLADNGSTSFGIRAFEEVTNDTCNDAETITVTSTEETPYNFDIGGADVLNEEGCDTSLNDYVDVWYEFTMPVNGNLFIAGVTSWNNFGLYDACNGNLIQCGVGDELISGLTSGTNYKLRVFRIVSLADNGSTSFGIRAFEEVTNDTCNDAETITVTATEETSYAFNIGGAEVNNEEGCDAALSDYVDVWYEFTMPVNGNLFIAGVTSWNNFGLYDACNGNPIQCGVGDELISGLTSGTNYKLRVFRTTNLADNGFTSFGIRAFEEVTNDTCNNAETITVTATEETSYAFNIGGAEVNNEEGCDAALSDYVDVWYEFTMPVNGNLFIAGVTSWNNFGLYDACNGNLIQCGVGDELIEGLLSATIYKLRVFRTVSLADNGFTSFGIQAFEVVPNDTCDNAETITVTTTEETTYNFTISGAEVNNEEGCDTALNDYVDVWYEFTMPVNGNLYINGVTSWNNFGLYDTCNGNLIQCGENNEFIEGLANGTTYKLRVFRTTSLADNGFTSFGLRAFEEVINDDCASAETITVTTTPATINFEIGGATINNEVGCSGTPAEDYTDIWYEFTLTEAGDIAVDGGVAWNRFALYDACAGTEVGCFDNEGDFIGLTDGTVYKLRVFRTLANADNSTFKSFSIQTTNTLSAADEVLENAVNVYPNPVANILHINSPVSIEAIEVYDINGRKILGLDNTSTIDMSVLTDGIYVLKLISENRTAIKKIIKR